MVTNVGTALSRCLRIVFGLYITTVVVLLLVWAPRVKYACKSDHIQYAPVFFALSLAIGLACFGICTAIKKHLTIDPLKLRKAYPVFMVLWVLMLIIVQCVVIHGGLFTSGWDVKILTDFGNYSDYAKYYSRYTNQWFLAGVFNSISIIGSLIGVQNGYICVVAIGCLCVDVSIVLVTCIATSLYGRLYGCAVLVFGSLFLGLSPWIFIPYSDTYSMVFATAILFMYTCCNKARLKWPGIAFLSIIGAAIKPTVWFALAAILAIEAFQCVAEARKGEWTGIRVYLESKFQTAAVMTIASVILAVAVACAIVSAVSIKESQFDYEPQMNYGAAHFLMMGFNPETMGVWNSDDVKYSYVAPSVEARNEGNIKIFIERVQEYGPKGVLILLLKKSMTNLGDGSLAWEQEGGFYINTIGTSEAVKSFYGIDDAKNGELVKARDPLFIPAAFVLWFLLLIGLCLNLLPSKSSRELDVMRLPLLFLLLFLMLFECRARYLLLYVPYFMVLALSGWRELYSVIRTVSQSS